MKNEEKTKELRGVKKIPPFKTEKIKGLIPDPTVTDLDGKKAPLFKK